PRDAGHLLHLEVAETGHDLEHRRQLTGALGRQWEAVGVAADRAVVVIRGHRVERTSLHGQAPERTARRLGAGERLHRRRRRVPKGDGNRSSRESQAVAQPPRDRTPVGHGPPPLTASHTCGGCLAASGTFFQCLRTTPSGPIHTVERITPFVFLAYIILSPYAPHAVMSVRSGSESSVNGGRWLCVSCVWDSQEYAETPHE